MGDIVDALVQALTPAVFFSQIEALVPLLVVLIPVVLGLYFLRRIVKGAAKAKVRF